MFTPKAAAQHQGRTVVLGLGVPKGHRGVEGGGLGDAGVSTPKKTVQEGAGGAQGSYSRGGVEHRHELPQKLGSGGVPPAHPEPLEPSRDLSLIHI